jgi:hypothetical protein
MTDTTTRNPDLGDTATYTTARGKATTYTVYAIDRGVAPTQYAMRNVETGATRWSDLNAEGWTLTAEPTDPTPDQSRIRAAALSLIEALGAVPESTVDYRITAGYAAVLRLALDAHQFKTADFPRTTTAPAALTRPAERHEYAPGDVFHRMHTDPLCRACGGVRGSSDHL